MHQQHFERMQIGDTIDVKGPLGHFEYTAPGKYLRNRKPRNAKKIAMIAGGTGITPCYQVAQHILDNPEDETEIALLYANKNEEVRTSRRSINSHSLLRFMLPVNVLILFFIFTTFIFYVLMHKIQCENVI